YLDISGTGALDHVEHGCCPPADRVVDDAPLSSSERQELKALIEGAAKGTTHVEDGHPTAEGSLSGTLQACTSGNVGSLLRDFARNDAGLDIVTVNNAPEAKQILDLVEAIVEQDMY